MSSNFMLPGQVGARSPAARAPVEDYIRDFFFYTAERLPLAANAAENFQIQIQGDSDFLLTALTGTVKALNSDEVLIGASPAVLLEIVSSGSGRILMDRAVPWGNIVGTAERPYVLSAPKTFPANSVITINFTNQAAAARQVRLTLHGYKVFAGY